MSQEIERKFLVTGPYKDRATGCAHIVQGYLCSARGRTVRVRLRDGRGYLTIKGPSDPTGTSRYEFEQEIPAADAEQLLQLCEPGIIDKRRWLVPAGAHTYEVDEFLGDNAGLVVAEVELRSIDEPFERLPFIGREVTSLRRYYNSQLRQRPYSCWTAAEQAGEAD